MKTAPILRYKGENSSGGKVIFFCKVERKDCPNIGFTQLAC